MIYTKLLLIGLAAGVAGGMFGIGGGLIVVPALLLIMKLTEHQAIGTSLGALIAPVGLLGAIQYYKAGHINPRYSAVIALGIFIGAYFGAKLFVGLSPVLVRRIYAGFLIIIGARLLIAGR